MTGMAHPILGDSNIRRKLDQDDRNAHPILGDSNIRRKLDQDDRNATSYIGRQ